MCKMPNSASEKSTCGQVADKWEDEKDYKITSWSDCNVQNFKFVKFDLFLKFYIVWLYEIFNFSNLMALFSHGNQNFRMISRGQFSIKISSVIYHWNQEKTTFPFLQSVFAQVSADDRYRPFSDFCTSMVKNEIWMLQMKLQLGIMIFHHSKTSPESFKVIW